MQCLDIVPYYISSAEGKGEYFKSPINVQHYKSEIPPFFWRSTWETFRLWQHLSGIRRFDEGGTNIYVNKIASFERIQEIVYSGCSFLCSRLSVRPSLFTHETKASEQIFMKFDLGDLHWNLSAYFRFGWSLEKIADTFLEDTHLWASRA